MLGGFCHDVDERFFGADRFTERDFLVGDLAARAAVWLVHHDAGVGEHVALAFGAAGEQDCAKACLEANTVRSDVRGNEVHRVDDSQAVVDAAARAVDIKLDVGLGVFVGEVQELRHYHIGCLLIDFVAQEDDAVLEEPRVNIIAALAVAGANDNVGDEVATAHTFSIAHIWHSCQESASSTKCNLR